MKTLGMLLALTLLLGVGLVFIFIADLDKAKNGEESLFWEEKDD